MCIPPGAGVLHCRLSVYTDICICTYIHVYTSRCWRAALPCQSWSRRCGKARMCLTFTTTATTTPRAPKRVTKRSSIRPRSTPRRRQTVTKTRNQMPITMPTLALQLTGPSSLPPQRRSVRHARLSWATWCPWTQSRGLCWRQWMACLASGVSETETYVCMYECASGVSGWLVWPLASVRQRMYV